MSGYQMLFDSISKLGRQGRIGFLMAALDDGMIELSEGWQLATDDQLAHWGVCAITNAAEAILQGKTLPSEMRGPKPFGVA